jgi:malonyl CoA-acyl carrier protein transacylase
MLSLTLWEAMSPTTPSCRGRQVAELCVAATEQAGQDKPVKIANYLCPGNYAVSGSKEGCDAVQELGKSFGARMTVSPLPAPLLCCLLSVPAGQAGHTHPGSKQQKGRGGAGAFNKAGHAT